ncbi:MAG: SdrD B-like domain-containing protein [Isosphaeraceae bacterium]
MTTAEASKRNRRKRRRPAGVEVLEGRQLLATIGLDAASGVLSIVGTPGADLARVEYGLTTTSTGQGVQGTTDTSVIEVTLESDQGLVLQRSFAASAVKSVWFDGQGGVDLLSNLTTTTSTWKTGNVGTVNTSLLVGSPGYRDASSVGQVGVFRVGPTGQVGLDYLYRGAGYAGQLGIFSLAGMDAYRPGSTDYIREAVRRALSDSTQGHVAIRAQNEGAKFTSSLPWEGSLNSGTYRGVHTVAMQPGDSFAAVLVPSGTFEQVAANPAAGGSLRPLFSVPGANPAPLDPQFLGQVGDLDGKGSLFAFEDLRLDGSSDRDYNDMVFQVTGARGTATPVSQVINPSHNFTAAPIFSQIETYAVAQETGDAVTSAGSYVPGAFRVGPDGNVTIDYQKDGAPTAGEVALFSCQGMDRYVPGSPEYLKEAARRALSDSVLGHVVISDLSESSRDSGNPGYHGTRSFPMTPGDSFGVLEVPAGTIWQLYNGRVPASGAVVSVDQVRDGGLLVSPDPTRPSITTVGMGGTGLGLGGASANPTDPTKLDPASICVVVYHDSLDNGKVDPADPSLPGIPVTLSGTDFSGNPVKFVATSGPDGCAEFPSVPAGVYRFTADDPTGATRLRGAQAGANGGIAADGGINGILLLPGVVAEGYSLGRVRPTSLSGRVFADADYDRIFDPSESPIAGVAVQLVGTDDLGGSVSASTNTDATGAYLFDGLRPGTYRIVEAQPAGYPDGRQSIGSFEGQAHPIARNGTIATDAFNAIRILPGERGYNYDFAEWATPPSGVAYQQQIDLAGTEGSDVVSVVLGATVHTITINGDVTTIDASVPTIVTFSGLGGNDTLTIEGIAGSESFTAAPNVATLVAPGIRLEIAGVAGLAFHGGVNDRAYLYDTRGNDLYSASPAGQQLDGPDYHVAVNGVDRVYAYAVNGGFDAATLYDSAGDDDFKGTPTDARIYGAGYYSYTRGFDRVAAISRGLGSDRAYLYDSAGNDTLTGDPAAATLAGKGYTVTAQGFPRVDTYFNAGGKDSASFKGSAGDDRFYGSPNEAQLVGAGFDLRAHGPAVATADGGAGGFDRAYLTGTQGDDTLNASWAQSRLTGPGLDATARAFAWVQAIGGSCLGYDVAYLADSTDNDTFEAAPNSARLYSTAYTIRADAFNRIVATSSSGGADQATLRDSPGDDTFVGSTGGGRFFGVGFDNTANGFAKLTIDGSAGGRNTALLTDGAGDDTLTAAGNALTLASATQTLKLSGFSTVAVTGSTGKNRKKLSAIDFALTLYGTWTL